MNNYNVVIKELRLAKGLLLKEASKKIGINRLKLYLYEAGYLRPNKKDKRRLRTFIIRRYLLLDSMLIQCLIIVIMKH